MLSTAIPCFVTWKPRTDFQGLVFCTGTREISDYLTVAGGGGWWTSTGSIVCEWNLTEDERGSTIDTVWGTWGASLSCTSLSASPHLFPNALRYSSETALRSRPATYLCSFLYGLWTVFNWTYNVGFSIPTLIGNYLKLFS